MTSMRDQLTPYTDAGRPPYVAALVVALGALILYIVTLAPTTQFWDASEYITAVHAFGIPHPPGNPLFILLAHAWGLLPLGADYARRINLLAAPALLVYVLVTDPRALVRPRFLIAAALVAAVGTSVDLFMPIRAHFDPYLNEGEPTTWQALQAVLARAQFGKPSVFANPMYPPGPDNPGHTLVLYGQQLLNYLQYFTWQFGHDWDAAVQRFLALAFAALGLAGARRQWRAERRAALALATLAITLTGAPVLYLKFRWGLWSPYNAPGLPHGGR